MDIVGVYLPAVLGALTILLVYFIGKELFNRRVGILAAGLIAYMPGEFLGRSILGFTDHHVSEPLFTAITMLFLILATKTAWQRQLGYSHRVQRDWKAITRPLLYSLLGGLFLGIYVLTWIGSALLILIIFVYFIIQFVIDHWRGKSTDYLGIIGTLSLLVATAMTLFFLLRTWARTMSEASLLIAMCTPLILNSISRLMASNKIRSAYYPLALIGSGFAGLAILHATNRP